MSLVAYGSSEESSDDEGSNYIVEDERKDTTVITVQKTNERLCLPTPKHDTVAKEINNDIVAAKITEEADISERIHFDTLPKPKGIVNEWEDIVEEGDIPSKMEIELKSEKTIKKERAPVRITVPSLAEFKDLEEENEPKINRIKPSTKGTKLFSLLPPPKGLEIKSTSKLIPTAVNKAATKITEAKVQAFKGLHIKSLDAKKITEPSATKSSIGLSYDSNSEEEDEAPTDFFALTATKNLPELPNLIDSAIDLETIRSELMHDSKKSNSSGSFHIVSTTTDTGEPRSNSPQATLVSNIMNLPKEEILQKNKAEVGPKLPVPEQEYNVDVEGNVAFDDKAIEYLCGRRGVKRKSKEIEKANIIEINGEDIKPDEREWLVKALTEEPVQRPISMQGGVNSQSKKKHQITYLAHQAKAMEMELKNQWAQNRLTRQQTQSKYGF